MQELKKIGVLSAAKISTMFGLVAGIIMTLYLWALYTFTPAEVLASMGIQASAFTFVTALTVLLLQVVLYFVVGVIGAALYNCFAKLIGGVSVDLKDAPMKKKTSKKK